MKLKVIPPLEPQKPPHLKKLPVKAVLFLIPCDLGGNPAWYYDNKDMIDYSADELIEIARGVKTHELDLVVKPHPKSPKTFIKHLEKEFEITKDKAYDLIYSADRIYSFKHCTTRKDCQVLGKQAIIVGERIE